MSFDTDPATFFASNQDVPLQHEFANVLEPDGRNVQGQVVLASQLVDHSGGGEGFHHLAPQPAVLREVLEEDRKDLVRINERSVPVNGAQAVGIPVRGQTSVTAATDHGAAKVTDVRLNGFGVKAREQRIV